MDRHHLTEIAEIAAARRNKDPKEVELDLLEAFEVIKGFLKQGDEVALRKFLILSPRRIPAKMSVNPRTGEPMYIGGYIQIDTSAAEAFKKQLKTEE